MPTYSSPPISPGCRNAASCSPISRFHPIRRNMGTIYWDGSLQDSTLAGDKRAMESWRPSIRPSLALCSPPRPPRLRVISSAPARAEAQRRRAEEKVEGLRVRAPAQSSSSPPGSSRPDGRVPPRGDGDPAVACSSSSSKHVPIVWKHHRNMFPLPGKMPKHASIQWKTDSTMPTKSTKPTTSDAVTWLSA